MSKSLMSFIMIVGLALSILITGTRPVFAQQVSEGQRLAMYCKPSVVRILDGYVGKYFYSHFNKTYTVPYVGMGSGSFINPSGYIVTNAHVVNMTHDGDEKAKEALFPEYVKMVARDHNMDPRTLTQDNIRYVVNNTRLLELNHIHMVLIPDGSSFPFEIKSFGAPIGSGKDVAIIKIEVKNAPIMRIGDSDKLQLQDHVTVLGYPAAGDTFQMGILDSKSALEASITDGKLSAKKNASDNAPILQVSAAATHGSSGGPVINDKGELIGLLTFRGDTVSGQEVSGFAFAVPATTIMEFVKQAGTTNDPGILDQRYREGLDLFWDASYTKAIAKFEEVKRLFPQHSEADRLIRDSQQAISEGKERSFPLLLVVGVGGFLFLMIVVGVVIVVVVASRRKKAHPAAAAGQMAPQQWGQWQQPAQQQSMQHQPMQHPNSQQPMHQSNPQQQMHQQQMHQQQMHQQPMHQSAPQGQPQAQYSSAPQAPPYAQYPTPPQAPQPEKTVVIDKTQALTGSGGWLHCTSGALAGQRFEVGQDGVFVGRDVASAQVVINDPRVSKRHFWIGLRNGLPAVVDQGSTNGTYLNALGSQRITETILKPGDTVILCEADVARFQYSR